MGTRVDVLVGVEVDALLKSSENCNMPPVPEKLTASI